MDDRILKKISKVRELALRGSDGERENAEVTLARLLVKYNIEEEDLLEDVMTEHEFQAYGQFGVQLFYQICANVVGSDVKLYHYTGRRNCKTRFVKCTEAQFIEISEMFEFYRYHLDEGMKSYFDAFIQVERLFANDVEPTEMSTEEIVEYYNSDAYRLRQNMLKHDRHLALPEEV